MAIMPGFMFNLGVTIIPSINPLIDIAMLVIRNLAYALSSICFCLFLLKKMMLIAVIKNNA